MPRYIVRAYIKDKLKKVLVAAEDKSAAESNGASRLIEDHNCNYCDLKLLKATKMEDK